MSALVEIRPATVADALALVLRQADREEVEALTGRDPREALVASVERSASAWAGPGGRRAGVPVRRRADDVGRR